MIRITRAARAFVASILFLLGTIIAEARADWMNLTGAENAPTIAEVTVLDDRVRIALEVYVGDLAVFEALLPDALLKKNTARPPAPRQRKERASAFAGMIDPLTRQQVPGPPEDKRVLYAELDYPFSGQPDSLTITPPLDENGVAATTVGFIAYRKAVPIVDFRYLTGAARANLDWDDPWYTKFDNPNLKRHRKSALMSFLYLEPREVRHEVLIRVRDLQEWTGLDLKSGTMIDTAAQARIKEHARSFFAARNPLEVDGTLAEPASTRADFLKISLAGLQVIEDEQPLDLSTAIIGLILSYPTR